MQKLELREAEVSVDVPLRLISDAVLATLAFYVETFAGKALAVGWSVCTPQVLCALAKDAEQAAAGFDGLKAQAITEPEQAATSKIVEAINKATTQTADYLEQLLASGGSSGPTLPVSFEDLSRALPAGVPDPAVGQKILSLTVKNVLPQFDQCRCVKEALERLRPQSPVLLQVPVDVKLAAKVFPVVQKVCGVEAKVVALVDGSTTPLTTQRGSTRLRSSAWCSGMWRW